MYIDFVNDNSALEVSEVMNPSRIFINFYKIAQIITSEGMKIIKMKQTYRVLKEVIPLNASECNLSILLS